MNLADYIPKCPICHGRGLYTQWQWNGPNTNPCEVCLTTGYKGRWLIWLELRRTWWVDGYVPQFYSAQFNPMLYPPMPWTCRGCNGVGCEYDGFQTCEYCEGDGLRWHWVRPVLDRWGDVREWWHRRKAERGISEDEIPF